MKIKGDCNCGKKLNCGCTLSFSSYIANSVSVLDVGTLQGGTCTFSQYVIDWFRDGAFYMTTGLGSNPDISAYHPFTGSAAIPVAGGTYIPVLRYVVLTGQTTKIFAAKKSCQDWCTFAGTLPTITVSSIYCGLTGGSPVANYDYVIKYLTTQDFALASRKFLFTTNETTKYFAISFIGYAIADRIKIWLNNYETLLQDWIIGSDAGGQQTVIFPYKYNTSTYTKITTKLPAYQNGNFLTLEVFPAVISGNTNTQWDLNMKCLTELTVFETDIFSDSMRNWLIETATFTYNSTLCRYEFTMEFERGITNPTSGNLYKYCFLSYSVQNCTYNTAAKTLTHYINYTKGAGNFYYTLPGQVKATSAVGMYFTKTGGLFTFEYLSQTDYDNAKNAYEALLVSTIGAQWSNDPTTNLQYYQIWRLTTYLTATSCGDNEVSRQYQLNRNAVFVWDDDNRKFTMDVPLITNQYVMTAEPCNTIMTNITSTCNNANSSRNQSNVARTFTKCFDKFPVGQIQYPYLSTPALYSDATWSYSWAPKTIPETMLESKVYCGSGIMCYGMVWNARVTINATKDANGNWLLDPLLNYTVTWGISKTTWYSSVKFVIYQVVDGVVVTALNYNDL